MDREKEFFEKLSGGEKEPEEAPRDPAAESPGSDDDLVIVRYDDDAFLPDAGSPRKDAPPEADAGLVIVRDAADEFAMEVPEHEKKRFAGPPPPPPTPRPARPEGEFPLDESGEGPSEAGASPSPRDSSEEVPWGDSEDESPLTETSESILGIDWEAELGMKRRPAPGAGPAGAGDATGAGAAAAAGGAAGSTSPEARPAKPRPKKPAPPAAPTEPPPPPEPVEPLDPEEISADEIPKASTRLPAVSRIAALAAVPIVLAAGTLSYLGIEPVRTWLYLFAWYPFLALVNHATAVRSPDHSIWGARLRGLAPLFAASVPVWILFEILNFRLEDWYYVGVPDGLLARRLGVILSFATVLPGIFFLEESLAVRRFFARARAPVFEPTPRVLRSFEIAGAVLALLAIVAPTIFFPIVWIIPVLLLEPWLFRSREASLLSGLSAGRPARVYRLLVAGLVCGIFWEAANSVAGGRWIYSVPGLDSLKIFEMPPLGFLGFPPFALACWSLAKALVRLGVIPNWEVAPRIAVGAGAAPGRTPPAPLLSEGLRAGVTAAIAILSLAALAGMDRWTVDSRTPRPEDVPRIPDGVTEWARPRGGDDVRGLLRLIEDGALYIPGESSAQVIGELEARCRLILLRGIGTANARRLEAVGVDSIEELAARERRELTEALARLDERGWRPRERRVAVWIAGAKRAAGI